MISRDMAKYLPGSREFTLPSLLISPTPTDSYCTEKEKAASKLTSLMIDRGAIPLKLEMLGVFVLTPYCVDGAQFL